MSRRNKIIVVVLILLFLLGILLLLLLAPPQAPEGPTDKNIPEDLQGTPTGGLNTSTGVNVQRPPLSQRVEPPETEEPAPLPPEESANVRRIAVAFAERFGSFSNQGEFENIIDLKAFMSTSMILWADAYVAEAQASSQASGSAEYYGITTRAVSNTLDAFDEVNGAATVSVNTQRNERRGLANSPNTYYQEIVITFVKEGTAWKVDSAEWTPL